MKARIEGWVDGWPWILGLRCFCGEILDMNFSLGSWKCASTKVHVWLRGFTTSGIVSPSLVHLLLTCHSSMEVQFQMFHSASPAAFPPAVGSPHQITAVHAAQFLKSCYFATRGGDRSRETMIGWALDQQLRKCRPNQYENIKLQQMTISSAVQFLSIQMKVFE